AFDIVKRVAQLEFHHFAAISNPFLFVRTGFPETVQFLVETDDELSPLAAKFNALRITGIPEFTAGFGVGAFLFPFSRFFREFCAFLRNQRAEREREARESRSQ